MKKNLLTLAAALLVATSAWAQTTFTAENLKYKVTDATAKTVTLTGYETAPTGALTIPATVTHEGTIYSVTSIGDEAFFNCTSLTGITLPDGLTTIGNYAFYACWALTQFNVDEANTAYCSDGGVLFNKDKTTLLQYPVGKTETDYAVPASVNTIERNAFAHSTALTQVTLPESLESIGNIAFYECTGLTEMTVLATTPPTLGTDVFLNVSRTIPVYVPAESLAAYQAAEVWKEFTNLKPIGSGFTAGNLKYEITDFTAKTVELTGYVTKPTGALTIPATVTNEGTEYSVTSIGSRAFSLCSHLTAVTIPEGVATIGHTAFERCSSLTAVTLPDGLTTIGNTAFYNCSSLTAVTLPDGLTTIGISAFFNCTSLTGITLPDGLTTIGNTAFSNCTSLTGITIPNTVTSIGSGAFRSCSSLATVTIGSSVTSIGEWAFDGCTALAEMTVLATVPPTVAANTFKNVSRTIPVYVPAASLAAYQAAEVWKEFTNLQAIGSTGLQTPAMPESIRIYNGTLHNPQGLHLTLYDMQGRQVYSGTDATLSQPAGVYVVRCNGASGKVLF